MILIINQHKGEWRELVDHIENYVEKALKDEVYMVLTVDQEMTSDQKLQVEGWNSQYLHILTIANHPRTLGLSASRANSYRVAFDTFQDPESLFSHVILGCTNSKWKVPLGVHLVNEGYPGVTVIPCDYKNDPFDRDYSILKLSIVSFDRYFNDKYKPDMTLMFEYCHSEEILEYYMDESYMPEEMMIRELCVDNLMNIYPKSLQEAWYNSTGISRNFDRKFMIDNKKGFHRRSTYFLDAFVNELSDDRLLLSSDKLKALTYDFVTLGEGVDLKRYKGTVLEPTVMWALEKWLTNNKYNHELKFKEDESRY